jgi:NAD-dependent dihydropyrimidine dehydrogenase PreA subunit
MDGSGEFYITIDTDLCIECVDHSCVASCPADLFEIIIDDYDDEVAAIKDENRKKIKYDCGPCKPVTDRPPLPCVAACAPGAISHSW